MTLTLTTRREFLVDVVGAGALILTDFKTAMAETPAAELERNKAVALRFVKAQGTKEELDVMREVLSPNYRSLRGGMHHLAVNAEGQGFPSAGSFLRGAFPDRVDLVEEVIAERDEVGILFRMTGTHRGNLFGIPPTGKKIDVYEIAILRLADGKIVEGWYMADEAAVLKQLGTRMPERKDGHYIVPPVTNTGEDPDAVVRRLQAGPLTTLEDIYRLIVARSKGEGPPADLRAADFKQIRNGFPHLRDYGIARGARGETVTRAFPDRRDRIDGFIAEGNSVWMRFKVAGTHTVSMYGIPATGKVVEVAEIGTATFVDGKWARSWYFGDELGMILQLGLSPNILVS